MRKVKKYKKKQHSIKQKNKLATINKLQDDIAKHYFDFINKKRSNY